LPFDNSNNRCLNLSVFLPDITKATRAMIVEKPREKRKNPTVNVDLALLSQELVKPPSENMKTIMIILMALSIVNVRDSNAARSTSSCHSAFREGTPLVERFLAAILTN